MGEHAAYLLAGCGICRTGTRERILVESGKSRSRWHRPLLSLAVLTLLAGAWAKPLEPVADTVIVNARIYTVDDVRPYRRVIAIATLLAATAYVLFSPGW